MGAYDPEHFSQKLLAFWLLDESQDSKCKTNLKTKSEFREYLEYNLSIYHFPSPALSEFMSNQDFFWFNTTSNFGSNITNKNKSHKHNFFWQKSSNIGGVST